MDHDEEAFSWAISHIQYRYRITEEPSYTEWPSHIGAQLLVADGLLQALSTASGDTSTADRERFVTETYRTLRKVRNSAVQATNSNIDEICNDDRTLRSDFQNLFACILPSDMRQPSAKPSSGAPSKLPTTDWEASWSGYWSVAAKKHIA